MHENSNAPHETISRQPASDALPNLRGRFEITALGMIAALIVACWALVVDGTLQLFDYAVFVSFLMVGAGALVWRIFNLPPAHSSKTQQ
jgi:hypothetical protein